MSPDDPRTAADSPSPSDLAEFTATDAAICACALQAYARDLRDLPRDVAENALRKAMELDPTLERFTCWTDYVIYVRGLQGRMAKLGGIEALLPE